MALKLLITDFDGTLVDTFEANYSAYEKAFARVGMKLERDFYRKCFGLRFDGFMDSASIDNPDLRRSIREAKSEYYPEFFSRLRVNRPLLEVIRQFRKNGGRTAVASTARGNNLHNALRYIGAEDDFDLILAGESVSAGKPDPEIYLTVLGKLGVEPNEALIFEDSPVGFQAAEAAMINYIPINSFFFDNGN